MKMCKVFQKGRKHCGKRRNCSEIAYYEQFLLFPQCLQKTCTADTYKTKAFLGGRVKMEIKNTQLNTSSESFQD